MKPFAVQPCVRRNGDRSPVLRHGLRGGGGINVSSAVRSTDTAPPPLAREYVAPCRRADASRNHERILSAARAVFIVDGPQASLDEVARRADIGDATLYHHFGDRDDLIRQVATHVIVQVAGDAESALAENDAPFQALRRCLEAAASHGTGAVPQVMRGRLVRAPAPNELPGSSPASTDLPSTSAVPARRR